MSTPIVRAMLLVELVAPKTQDLHLGLTDAFDTKAEPPSPTSSSPSRRLDLSASRTQDRALDILSAYKLTGNFYINLEIVLKDLGAFDKVAYKIESETLLPFRSDRRQVAFWPNKNVPMERFDEIMRSLTGRIGFDATPPWWRIVVGRRRLGGSR